MYEIYDVFRQRQPTRATDLIKLYQFNTVKILVVVIFKVTIFLISDTLDQNSTPSVKYKI